MQMCRSKHAVVFYDRSMKYIKHSTYIKVHFNFTMLASHKRYSQLMCLTAAYSAMYIALGDWHCKSHSYLYCCEHKFSKHPLGQY